MALKKVRRLWQERADGTGESRTYLVEYDTATEYTVWDARDANDGTTAIPADGAPLSVGSNVIVTSKVATRLENAPQCTRVEVAYSVPAAVVFEPNPGGPPGGKWGITISVEPVIVTEFVTNDRDGLPIQNSAGMQFDPMPQKDYYDERVTIGYSTDTLEWDLISGVFGFVNDSPVVLTIRGSTRTFDTECLKLEGGTYQTVVGTASDGTPESQWRVTLQLLHRPTNWKRKIVDAGYYTKGDDGGFVPILDAHGTIVQQPAFLDGDGAQLASGADAILLEFDIEDSTDFDEFLNGIG